MKPQLRPFGNVSRTVASEIASRYTGNAQIRSIRRERIVSLKRPKKPAMRARMSAMKQQITADPMPISSDARPPYRTRAITSLPWLSAPRKKRSEEHTSELQSRRDLVCRLLLEKKK